VNELDAISPSADFRVLSPGYAAAGPGASRAGRTLPPAAVHKEVGARAEMRRRLTGFAARHPVVAVNVGMMAVVAVISLLVMILPFGEPANVLLAAALVEALAVPCLWWWGAGAEPGVS
jgi:hypothetical protein